MASSLPEWVNVSFENEIISLSKYLDNADVDKLKKFNFMKSVNKYFILKGSN